MSIRTSPRDSGRKGGVRERPYVAESESASAVSEKAPSTPAGSLSPDKEQRREAWRWAWLVVAVLWVVYNLLDFTGWGLFACSVVCAFVAAGAVYAVRRRSGRNGARTK